eukprot:1184641-Prorocentrum_minimum.AAC.2
MPVGLTPVEFTARSNHPLALFHRHSNWRYVASGARYGYILSPLLRLVPAMGIFALPFYDRFPLWAYSLSPCAIGAPSCTRPPLSCAEWPPGTPARPRSSPASGQAEGGGCGSLPPPAPSPAPPAQAPPAGYTRGGDPSQEGQEDMPEAGTHRRRDKRIQGISKTRTSMTYISK